MKIIVISVTPDDWIPFEDSVTIIVHLDMALVELQFPIEFTDTVSPICLPTPGTDYQVISLHFIFHLINPIKPNSV